jgi:hypothetical protein
MRDRRAELWQRISCGCGIAAVIVVVIGSTLPGQSPAALHGADSTAITLFYAAHPSELTASGYLLGLGAALLIVFFGGLRARLCQGDDGAATIATIGFGAAAAGAALQLGGAAIVTALAQRSDVSPDPATVVAMAETASALGGFAWFAFAVSFGVTAYLVATGDALPRFIAWLSAGLVPLALVSAPIPGTTVDSATSGVMLVWIVAISLNLVRRRSQPRRPASGRAAT